MFKNHFQGGSHVDVFVASGRDPKLKLANVEREYNGVMKGNVYSVDGSTSCAKFPFPFKYSKYSTLNLIQRFLIFQIYIPYSRDFAMELQITDISNNKRRIMLSTSVRDISCSALHIKFPISFVRREVWVNLCLDLVSLSSQILPSQSAYKSLESFTLSGTFKLRRIFTMKCRPYDTSNDDVTMDHNNSEPCTNIPQNLQFNTNLPACTQVITMNKLRSSLTPVTTSASAASGTISRTELTTTSGYCSSSGDYDVTSKKKEQSTHIAFGTKVPFCPPPRTRHLSTSSTSTRKHDTSSADSSTPRRSKPTQSRSADPIRRGGGKRTVPPVKPPTSARSQRQDGGSSNLLQLVDELEKQPSVNMFTFASQPRSVPRHRSESISTTASSTAHDGDFLRDSDESEEEDPHAIDKFYIRQVTRRSPTPSPQLPTELLPRPPPAAMTSLSPIATKHGVGTSEGARISTRSSNATLTASVNTLVHNSISVMNQRDERGDPQRWENPHDDPQHSTEDELQQDDSLDEQQSVTISRRSVREVEGSPPGNPPHQAPPPPVKILESSNFQVGTWSDSLEEEILLQMKKEVDEEITTTNNKEDVDIMKTNFQDNLEDSFDTSWSTYKNPPPMQPQAYDSEMRRNDPNSTETTMNGTMKGMNTMTIFNSTHEWGGVREEWGTLMCSPPPVLPSERRRIQESSHTTTTDDIVIGDGGGDFMGLSDGSGSIKSCTTQETSTDDEMMLDLMYDPCLNCYFDPKTGKYYQLKN